MNGQNSAVNNETGRLLSRIATITDRRPDEPRDFVGTFPGWITWLPPQIKNFTHYLLRIDDDQKEPDYMFPARQHSAQIFKGRRLFLCTFNEVNEYESGMVALEYDAEGDFRKFAAQAAGDVMVRMNVTMDSSPYAMQMPAPSPVHSLITWLRQDTTGGRVPAWPAFAKNGPTTAIDGTPETLSWVRWEYEKVEGDPAGEDAWYCAGYDTGLATL